MYNLRYHVASLVAVFLALTVGLVLGGLVAERGSVGGQVESVVRQLQTRFDTLAQENADLKRSLESERAFGKEAAAALTKGVLAGRRVAILVNAGRADGLEAARSAVEHAGGSVAVIMIEQPQAGLDSAVPSVLGKGVEPGRPAVKAAARAVAAEIATSGPRPVLDALVDAGALSVRSLDGPIDGCVVMAATGDAPDAFALAVGGALADAGVRAVGVEATGRNTGVAAAASGTGMSAVDHVDLPAGTLSLVWCLADRADGWYGLKKGAAAPFPQLSGR
ncbi:MAG: copper transporter [Coriobacteriia bacterium]|nr:copper transporter [Coriobacteriia bacterium]